MALLAGIGKGKDKDPFEAGRNAARDIAVALKNVPPEAMVMFLSSRTDQQKFLDGVRSIFPEGILIGASTAGHFTPDEILDDGGVLLALTSDHSALFASAVGNEVHSGEFVAASEMMRGIEAKIPKSKLSAVVAFSDGLAGNGIELLRGLTQKDGPKVGVLGGFSADHMAFTETYQYEGRNIHSNTIVGLGISGCTVGGACEHGWKPIGIPMKATKTEGALLLELDHAPAYSMYEKYFGEVAREFRDGPMSKLSLMYPLGMRTPSGDILVRTPLSIDDGGGILTGAEIPEGSEVRLLLGSKDAMVSAASRAAHRAKQSLGARSPKAAIVISSMTRRKILGADAMKEIHAVVEVLGAHVPMIGFYGYGEFSPLPGEGAVFQNESIVVIVLAD